LNLRRSEKSEYSSLFVYFSFGFGRIFRPFIPTKISESRENNMLASTMVEALTLRTIRYGGPLVSKGS
jgi:hypothetical protein